MNRPDPNSPDQSANKDDDAVWLDLVARLEATDSSAQAEPSESEGSEPGQAEPGPSFKDFDPLGLANPPVEPASPGGITDRPSTDEPPTGPRDYEGPDDEPFVPEEPPSLAGTEPLTMLSWIGAVGGPVALLFTAMFWRSAPLTAILGIVAVFVASVIYLIMRLPQEKDDDDDGARI
ncbi:hypothetical protein [Arthrobacter sp. fls2-241-R2A-200]|uniref:hypothetical protein n=1 Tax=Arthrobacter sp. fls2-241-R2A-200 TaxID=3040281 RepID=UPI00254CAD99|nr:hypothetical protein [Arthrobacter sp. fls2-241-R2A-200]